jgi:phospholipid-binding lipoprotein MlaA
MIDARLNHALRAAVAAACFAVGGADVRAATYDMSMFLNEPHPFDDAPVSAPKPDAERSDGDAESEPVVEEDDDGDPLEPLNRMVFQFNQLFNGLVLEPAATVYDTVVPDRAQQSVKQALNNLGGPVVLANDLLQAEWDRAWTTTQRTAINSTIGVAGLFDVASEWDINGHSEDFGQTLGVWGVDEYAFLMLPVFGPSSPRDAVGKFVVDGYFDAFGYLLGQYHNDESALGLQVLGGVNQYNNVREDLKTVEETSIDFYAALRSLYRQNRASEIANSEDAYIPQDLDYDIEGLDEEFDDVFDDVLDEGF